MHQLGAGGAKEVKVAGAIGGSLEKRTGREYVEDVDAPKRRDHMHRRAAERCSTDVFHF